MTSKFTVEFDTEFDIYMFKRKLTNEMIMEYLKCNRLKVLEFANLPEFKDRSEIAK